ncbi:MAG: YncE family protein [Candidatus Rokubacteria bacterium]|nr:YncE family protein [Candidatus Rokubacteria bacterium]
MPETQADVPFGIAVHPNGSRLYVTNNKTSGFLTVIDFTFDPNDLNALPGYAFVKTVTLGNAPSGVAVSPDGNWVFVAQADGNLVVVNATGVSENVLEQAVGGELFGVATHPTDPRKVYVTVTNPPVGMGMVDPVDTLTVLEWTDAQPLPMAASVITPVPVGKQPRGVAVTPGSGLAYVANFGSNNVSVINTAAIDPMIPGEAVIATIAVGTGPVALGQFIGFPGFDKDGDGIWNLVDGYIGDDGNFVDQSDVASINFTNRHLCGTTSGSITTVPTGMTAVVASPAGIIVGAAGGDGTQQVTVHACGFDIHFNPFEAAVIDNCGSLTTQVLSGPIEVVLPDFGVATVPTGVTVRVAQIAPGQFEVQNLGGPAAITVDFAGHVILVAPGRSRTVSGAELVHDVCPCAGPSAGGAWKNHGAYVSCIAREADDVAKSGLITHKEKGALQSQAARSSCGVK